MEFVAELVGRELGCQRSFPPREVRPCRGVRPVLFCAKQSTRKGDDPADERGPPDSGTVRTSGLRGMGMKMGRERKIEEVGQNEGSWPRRHVFFFSNIFYFCSPFNSNSI